MYEVTWIKSLNDKERDFERFPKVQVFEQHSPIMVGVVLYLVGREGDGKTVVTSPVQSLYLLRSNIMEVTTKNSVYEIKEI